MQNYFELFDLETTFFISDSKVNVSSWNNFKSRFPHAQKIENCESYETLNKKTLTKNFWVVWDCLHIDQDFDFTYRLTEWDNQYIHVFKNGEHYDGVCLFPKNLNVSSKEWKYRFFTNKKEIDILASRPKPYDIIKLDSYEGLVTAQEIALTARAALEGITASKYLEDGEEYDLDENTINLILAMGGSVEYL